MEAILRVHFGDLEEKLVKQALAAFYWLRELRGIEKKPCTSELVDWLRALVAGGVDPAPHREGDPLRRRAAEKGQGSADPAESRRSKPCSPRFFTCCVSGGWTSP